MTIPEFRTKILNNLEQKFSTSESSFLLRILFETYLNIGPKFGFKDEKTSIEYSKQIQMLNALDRLCNFEPWQYVVGEVEFCNLKLKVNKSVLIPRPETEELTKLIISDYKSSKNLVINDFCAGSGCIGLSLAKCLLNSKVFLFEKSSESAKIAKINKEINKINAEIIEIDLLSEQYLINNNANIIVSNPPYVLDSERASIEANVLKYEPEMALFVPNDDPLIFYKKIIHNSIINRTNDCTFYFEINENFKSQMYDLLDSYNLKGIEIKKDFLGKFRFAKANFILA